MSVRIHNNTVLAAGTIPNPAANVVTETWAQIYEHYRKTVEGEKLETKEFVTEANSRIIDADVKKKIRTAPEELYRIARAAIEGDVNARKTIKFAFLKTIASEAKTEVEKKVLLETYSMLFDNVFTGIALESQAAQLSTDIKPYIMLSLPLLRVFFPRTVLKKVATTVPVNLPSVAMYFIRFVSEFVGQTYNEPYDSFLTVDSQGNIQISPALGGLGAWETHPISVDLPLQPTNVIDLLKEKGVLSNAIPSDITLQRGSIKIVGIGLKDDNGNTSEVPVNIVIDEAGFIGGSVSVPDPANPGNTYLVYVTGQIDFRTNTIFIQPVQVPAGYTAYVKLTARISLETRNVVQELKVDFQRIDFEMQRVEKTIKFTPEFAYDAKALFNIDIQTELLTVLATLLAVNTDAIGLLHMYQSVKQAAPQNIETVDVSPAALSSYLLGPKYYYEAYIIPALNKLIGRLYARTVISDADVVLVCHPEDASYFKSMNNYESVIQHLGDSAVGVKVGQLNKEVTVYDTPVMPAGHVLVALVPRQTMAAVTVYAPYVTLFMPYPAITAGPAFTGVHRFGFRVVRPEGLGILRLVK